jgi:hypothetical protein
MQIIKCTKKTIITKTNYDHIIKYETKWNKKEIKSNKSKTSKMENSALIICKCNEGYETNKEILTKWRKFKRFTPTSSIKL